MSDVAILERGFISACMDLEILIFPLSHALSCRILISKFFYANVLHRRRSVRYLCFPLTKTMFELNFSAMGKLCFSMMHVNLNIVW